MNRLALALILLPPLAADSNVDLVLKKVEDRYNRVKTLEVQFTENYNAQGRERRGESGRLYLRKPGRMRWDYSKPAGKQLVSDGKSLWFFSPSGNRVEKVKMKESEDMRAPLAFLLGRLDFHKDFQGFQLKHEAGREAVTALPKSDRLPYREVTFHLGPRGEIERLVVTGQDASVLDFQFAGEKLNPLLDDKLFRFQMPPGAEFVDTTQEGRR